MRNLNILQIPSYPTVVGDVHESVYRAYAILGIVEHLLEEETPPRVVLAILQELRRIENLEVAKIELLRPAAAQGETG